MVKLTVIPVAVLIGLLLIGSASAYAVPVQYRGQAQNDVDLIRLAQQHTDESWARYVLDDLGYRYNTRNAAQFKQRIEYQSRFSKIVRNNLVRENN